MTRTGQRPSDPAPRTSPLRTALVMAGSAAAVTGVVVIAVSSVGGLPSEEQRFPAPANEVEAAVGDGSAPPCSSVRAVLVEALSQGWKPALLSFDDVPASVVTDDTTRGSAFSISAVTSLTPGLAGSARAYVWLDPPVTESDRPSAGRYLAFLRPVGRATEPDRRDLFQYHSTALWSWSGDGVTCSGQGLRQEAVKELARTTPVEPPPPGSA